MRSKIREAEEKAFKAAEAKRMELIEAEKKQYEEYVEAQKKAVEEAVTKEKEFYEKERELVKKLGGYPYAFGGAYGYGHPGYAGYAGYGAAAGYGGYYGARAGYLPIPILSIDCSDDHPNTKHFGYSC